MRLKFFGQFMLQQGAITLEQLREALAMMERANPKLDELAVELELITPGQRAALKQESEATGSTFEELIEDEQLLSEEQLNRLLDGRGKQRLELADALLALGHLSDESLRELVVQYQAERRPFYETSLRLPGALGRHRPARSVVGLMCRLLPNMAGITVDESGIVLAPAPELSLPRAVVVARGVAPLRVELRAERKLAVALAHGMTANDSLNPSDTDCNEAVAELLNVVVGNAVALLEEDGLHLSLIPPDPSAPAPGSESIELSTNAGKGWLLMDPTPPKPREPRDLEPVADA